MTAPSSAASVFESAEPASTIRSPRRGRVLVIDDEIAICRSLQRLLGKDHDVTIECDPRAGAEMAASGTWDVILCDLMMPVMTGMDVYEALRARAPEVTQRVIFMTAGTFSLRSAAFLETTENLHLTKPFESARLRRIVHEFLGRADEVQMGRL